MRQDEHIVNFRPWHVNIVRLIRCLIVVAAMVVVMLVTYSACILVSTLKEIEAEIEIIGGAAADDLQKTLQDITDNKKEGQYVLEILELKGYGINIETILSVSEKYEKSGINIFSIGEGSVVGQGTTLDIVTKYIKELSDTLGYNVELYNITQLNIGEQTTIGFELKIGGVVEK